MPRDTFATLPDPAEADSPGDLVERLRLLKVWAGDPSYETIKDRVNEAWRGQGRPAGELARRSTVANCFQAGRRRFNTDLVIAVVEALHPDLGYVAQWRQALRVIGGEIEAVSQVRVQDTLPRELAGFTGRAGELDRLRHAARGGGAVLISAIEGMAGVGKTQLAVHAGHALLREKAFERVLFVNLRGFHPDPGQPPADPAAVLDGFLRLLGVPGHRIPHDLPARTAAYRERLTGTRTLVVLDNAATAEQAGPLLPATPGCLALVTSRRSLTGLGQATRLAVDVFAEDEAVALLTGAIPDVPAGSDPGAAARIARRCGHLPLALSLIAGHIRNTPGWTLTDHAERLDERHRQQRLDNDVELALDLSYHHLPAGHQRLLRLLALHPGQDLDAYAAAALTGTGLAAARAGLAGLCADHLLQQTATGRYVFHDLVRAYATARAHDQDRPPERRAALTRLFDHYVATVATAMTTLFPAEAHRWPHIPPATTPSPDLHDTDAAVGWLDAERPTLVAVATHTATQGWPGHTTRLARTLSRYLNGGYHNEAVAIHSQALHAGRADADPIGQAHALAGLGYAHLRLGRPALAGEHFEQALDLFRRTDDPAGQARVLYSLGIVAEQSGRHPEAVDHLQHALQMYRRAGDRAGESNTLNGLGIALQRAGRAPEGVERLRQALALAEETGNQRGLAIGLHGLGELEIRTGEYGPAGEHLRQALDLYRQFGNPSAEAGALDSLGQLHTRLGRPGLAAEHHEQALAICRGTGHQVGEAWALNGLGEAAHAAGRAADALAHHAAASTIATDGGMRDQQARAHAGLGHAYRTLGDTRQAREHYQHALTHYNGLGMPEADQIRAILAELG